MSETRADLETEGRWVRVWGDANGWRLRVGREEGRLVAEWAGLGTLRVRPDGQEPLVSVAPGLGRGEERRWREGALRALLRHVAGRPTLHASAVALRGRAFVFLGASGAGKSTCAADLCARVGGQLLADDLAEIDVASDGVHVLPTAADHWLLPDSAAALGHPAPLGPKGPVGATNVALATYSLGATVRLTFHGEGEPTLTAVRGEAAFTAINASYARFIVDDPLVQWRDLDLIGRLAAAAPTYTLSRTRSFTGLEAAAALLTGLAEQLHGAASRGSQPCR